MHLLNRKKSKFTSMALVAMMMLSIGAVVNVASSGIADAKGPPIELKSVSCPTTTWCMAVGFDVQSSPSLALIEKWDGQTWSSVSSPSFGAGITAFLQSVSCVSTTSCVAVGSTSGGSGYATLIETWNGRSWTLAASPNPVGSQQSFLQGVSCLSSTWCTAVGDYDNGTNYLSLVESWNGTSWNITASPNAAGGQFDYLNSISCVSTTWCSAAGYYDNGSSYQTLIEAWNGAAWTVVSSPNLVANQYAFLWGVSCTDASFCTTVGTYSDGSNSKALIEMWNGGSWSLVSSPNDASGGSSELYGVSCVSRTQCTATGAIYATNDVSLAETWNGSAWAIAVPPNMTPTPRDSMWGISCASVTMCLTGGSTYNPDNYAVGAVYASPSAPVGLHAKESHGQVMVSWSSRDGNDTTYAASVASGGAHCSTTLMSCVIKGLLPNKTYVISVRATNSIGSASSVEPVSITLAAATTTTAPDNGQIASTGWNFSMTVLAAVGLLVVGWFGMRSARRSVKR
jgi:hypothetical protein